MKILIFSLLFLLIQCASGPVSGILFTNNDYAGEVNPDSSIPSVAEATSCQYSILGLISVGDSSAGQIASNVGIRRIATIDHSTFSILHIFFIRNCTIITGATH